MQTAHIRGFSGVYQHLIDVNLFMKINKMDKSKFVTFFFDIKNAFGSVVYKSLLIF